MLISGNPSEALATALQIENDNNNLIGVGVGVGGFGVTNENKTSKQRPSLMSAFDEEEVDTNQLSFLEQEEVEELQSEPIPNPIPVNNAMNLTDEMIEQILAEEERKAKIDDLLQEDKQKQIDPSDITLDMFEDEDDTETETEDMGWFPSSKE
jgi:hypothetical protein